MTWSQAEWIQPVVDKFSNKFDSPEITNEFIDKNYSKLIKSFKLPKGSLLIYDATGIHRAKPFKNNKYVRKSLYFQVDAYDENSEKILLNTKLPLLIIFPALPSPHPIGCIHATTVSAPVPIVSLPA